MNVREEAVLAALFEDPSARDELTPDELSTLKELEEVIELGRGIAEEPSGWSPIREGALVGRVLARTTREDLSWRGDLLLLANFVRERLAASPVLKLVAASLLVHLAALPVLGWYVLREPEKKPTITFDFPAEAVFSEEDEGGAFDPPVDPSARLAERIENARRRARFLLARGFAGEATVVATPGPAAPLEIRLLALRTFAGEERWEAWLDDEQRFARADRLQRVLWIELLLDRNVGTGQRSPLLGRGLNGLALAGRPAAPATSEESRPSDPALVRLEDRALRRARAYGLWEAREAFDPRTAPEPFGASWCAAIDEAFAERGLADHPVVAVVRTSCRP